MTFGEWLGGKAKLALAYAIGALNVLLVSLNGLGITAYLRQYEWWNAIGWLNWLLDHSLLVFILSCLVIFLVFRGAGPLGMAARALAKK